MTEEYPQWHKVVWTFKPKTDEFKEMFRLKRICHDAGISFDSGGGKDWYEWELDWSLSGGTVADVINILQANTLGEPLWELTQRDQCICSEPFAEDNSRCRVCFL